MMYGCERSNKVGGTSRSHSCQAEWGTVYTYLYALVQGDAYDLWYVSDLAMTL